MCFACGLRRILHEEVTQRNGKQYNKPLRCVVFLSRLYLFDTRCSGSTGLEFFDLVYIYTLFLLILYCHNQDPRKILLFTLFLRTSTNCVLFIKLNVFINSFSIKIKII